MRCLLTAALVPIVALIASARAHFPFIVAEPDGASARVVMSETLSPDPDVGIDILSGATFSLRDREGAQKTLTVATGENWLTLEIPGSGTRVLSGKADLGVMKRGEIAHVLIYHPKTIIGDAFDRSTELGKQVPVELVPARSDKGMRIRLLIDGEPAAATEVRVIPPTGEELQLTTDDAGYTPVLDKPGRYGAWARHWLDRGGERDGQAYAQERHYATLVFDSGSDGTSSAAPGPAVAKRTPLPEPTASFGAAACDGWLYVYGGHIVDRHDYSTDSVSGRFARLNLRDPTAAWESLKGSTKLQGMNLASARGRVYRVGGMEPRNGPDDTEDNWSIEDAAYFDPAEGSWTALPPLSRPRSSHDVIVVGDQLCVFGGWWMKGREGGAEWLDSVEILDLSKPGAQWRSVSQPFQRRALIVAALGQRVFVIGGFDSSDTARLDVDIYDLHADSWSKGPSIPGPSRNGFSPAACVVNGSLYVSVGTGDMYRLSADEKIWEPFAKTTPRVVHRMIPNGAEILVVGGAAESRMLNLVEAVPVK